MGILQHLPPMTIRQQDEMSDFLKRASKNRVLQQDGWRIKWNGAFVVMRSGNSLWDSKGKASSAFKSGIRNDWVLLYEYIKIRSGNPLFAWNDLTENHSEIAKDLTDYLISSGQVEFVQVHA